MNIVSSRTLFTRQTDERTNERRFAFLELLTEPKKEDLMLNCVNFQHHYSIKGGASAIGLGLDNCVQVACDER